MILSRSYSQKILTIMGPLSKVRHTIEEPLAGGSKKFDADEMS